MVCMWVILSASRNCESVETANEMSGHVITLTYISEPIISWYFIFSDGLSRFSDTNSESGVRSMPGYIGVTATLSFGVEEVLE